jgi:predicted dehydrogenase
VNAIVDPRTIKPRIGFLGVGWIGRHRLQALAESGVADIAAIIDPHDESLAAAVALAPDARACTSLDDAFADDLDGLVIATPSAAHAWQAIGALSRGLAVFCQKPLARTAAEAKQVVSAAQRADRLLDVDFSYRQIDGMSTLRTMLQSGELGDVYAIDLTFHNAYGPDKQWFYDLAQSGGGCVMDLGSHLVDLALWMCGAGQAASLDSNLFAQGRRLAPPLERVEDFATAQFMLGGTHVRLTCSWNLSAGCDAIIKAAFYGTRGGAALSNVNGSFYNFTLDHFQGTRSRRIVEPGEAHVGTEWGGRALVNWAKRVAAGERFDAAAWHLVDVARVVDSIYGR